MDFAQLPKRLKSTLFEILWAPSVKKNFKQRALSPKNETKIVKITHSANTLIHN